jgi:hypothetical protein
MSQYMTDHLMNDANMFIHLVSHPSHFLRSFARLPDILWVLHAQAFKLNDGINVQ